MESGREKQVESENHSSRPMSFPGWGGGASATRSLHLEKTASHDPQICGMEEEGWITEPTDSWYGGGRGQTTKPTDLWYWGGAPTDSWYGWGSGRISCVTVN